MSEDGPTPTRTARHDTVDRGAHRPWSTILQTFHILGLIVAAALLFLALIAGHDMGPGDVGEPFLSGMNGILLMYGSITGAVAGSLALWTHKGQWKADVGKPAMLNALATTACALAVVQVGFGLVTFNGGWDSLSLMTGGLYFYAATRIVKVTQ